MPGAKFKQVKDKNPDIEMYLAKVAKAESGNNPNAVNPTKGATATGLFQFTEGTWRGLNEKYSLGYNLEDRKNPDKAAKMMRLFTEDNERILKPVLGRDLNDADRYMSHFLGAGGASKFFKVFNTNPNAPASLALSPDQINMNKSVLYKKGKLVTVGELYNWANEKMNTKVTPRLFTETDGSEAPIKEQRPNLPTSSVPLETSTAIYKEPVAPKESTEVQQAKQEINEKSFLENLSQVLAQEPIPQQPEQQFELDPSAYNYINIEEY